jgi:CHAT domain
MATSAEFAMIEVSFEPPRLAAGQDCDIAVRFTNQGPGTCTHIVFRLDLPHEFLMLRGRDHIEIQELSVGRSWVEEVTVRPARAGTFSVASANFAYCDSHGTHHRIRDFRGELTVLPATPASEAITVEYAGGDLVLGERGALRLRVRNTGRADLRDLVLTIGGPLSVAVPGPRVRIPALMAGADHVVSFAACPVESGSSVQIHVHTEYTDPAGRTRARNDLLRVAVPRLSAQAGGKPARGSTAHKDTILYLAASPLHQSSRYWEDPERPEVLARLRVDKELEEIRTQLKLSRYGDRFRFEFRLAASAVEISRALAEHHPRIIHLSGHGDADGGIYVEDERGDGIPATPEGLARLLRLNADDAECVIVNACYSRRLAEAMRGYFDYTIGMRRRIGDQAAIVFSIGFYQGIAGGDTIPRAFERGCALVETDVRYTAEHDIPELLSKS